MPPWTGRVPEFMDAGIEMRDFNARNLRPANVVSDWPAPLRGAKACRLLRVENRVTLHAGPGRIHRQRAGRGSKAAILHKKTSAASQAVFRAEIAVDQDAPPLPRPGKERRSTHSPTAPMPSPSTARYHVLGGEPVLRHALKRQPMAVSPSSADLRTALPSR